MSKDWRDKYMSKLYTIIPDNTKDSILMPIRLGTCKLFQEPDGTKMLYANDKGRIKRFLIDENDC